MTTNHPAYDAAHRPDRLVIRDVMSDRIRFRRSDSAYCVAEIDIEVSTDDGPRWAVTGMLTMDNVRQITAWGMEILDPSVDPTPAAATRGNAEPWTERWKHRAEVPQGSTHLRGPDDATACGIELMDDAAEPDMVGPSWTTDQTDPEGVTCPACQDAVMDADPTGGWMPMGQTNDGQLVEMHRDPEFGGGHKIRIGGVVRDMLPGEEITGPNSDGSTWRLTSAGNPPQMMGDPTTGKSDGYLIHRTEHHMRGCDVDHDPRSSACPPFHLRPVRS